MKITKDEVLHVARLARLDIDEADTERFADQIGTILDYVDTLNRWTPPVWWATSHAITLTNAFREDEETPHLKQEISLANGPGKGRRCFRGFPRSFHDRKKR